MFGLLKPQKDFSKQSSHHKKHYGHYCELCKTIGVEYGHKARVTTNFDVTFLLALLQPDDYQSKMPHGGLLHCLKLPEKEQITEANRYTAAINVLLAGANVDDKVADGQGKHWRLVQLYSSPKQTEAKNYLRSIDFPLEDVERLLKEQAVVEAVKDASVQEASRPVAELTSLVFEWGSRFNDRLPMVGMKAVGYLLGKSAYVLDALEDLSQDMKDGQFNPLLVNGDLSLQRQHEAVRFMESVPEEMIQLIEQFDLTNAQKDYYRLLIKDNFENRLLKLKPTVKVDIKNLWQLAKENAGLVLSDLNQASFKFYGLTLLFFVSLPFALGQEPGGFQAIQHTGMEGGAFTSENEFCDQACEKGCNCCCDCCDNCGLCEKESKPCCNDCPCKCCDHCHCNIWKPTDFGCVTCCCLVPGGFIAFIVHLIRKGKKKNPGKRTSVGLSRKKQGFKLFGKKSKGDDDEELV